MILASGSPRRKELLERFGLSFTIEKPTIEENQSYGNPIQMVCSLSFEKAYSFWETYPTEIILGCDTVVALDENILGKPKSKEEAFQMLSSLSGKTHEVYSGYALLHPEKKVKVVNYSVTKVTFRTLEKEEIERYLTYSEYEDKAGAYGIQGLAGIFIEKIDGDYNNVVGLPLTAINEDLKRYFQVSLL